MTCAQSKARRRQARLDPRYHGQKMGDAQKRYLRMKARVDAEKLRQMRSKGKR